MDGGATNQEKESLIMGGRFFNLNRLCEGNFKSCYRNDKGWVNGCAWSSKSLRMNIWEGVLSRQEWHFKMKYLNSPCKNRQNRILGKSALKEENLAQKTE